MFSRDRWLEIFETIKKNKLRTFLSGFTVALGILIFIILFGLGNGLQSSFSMFFTDDQVNTIRVYPSTTTIPYRGYESKRRIKFTNDDVKKIKENSARNRGILFWSGIIVSAVILYIWRPFQNCK